MEWVEVTGETLEAAKEHALDQLGVALDDAEFEVVQVPESRWLGLKKTEARVRARVRPTQARPKKENRPRRGRDGDGETGRTDARNERSRSPRNGGKNRDRGRESGGTGQKDREPARGERVNTADAPVATETAPSAPADRQPSRDADRPAKRKKEHTMNEESTGELVPLEEQTALVESFLAGVLTGFGLDGTVTTRVEDDDIVGDIEGEGLGLLIGPKGGTIRALQEVTRAAAQRHADGRDTRRTNVDVGGYRERRRVALAAFATRQAEVVRSEGRRVALEPMGSADRKTIHDTIMEIEGVRSISEGDDPRRRVVLLPDD